MARARVEMRAPAKRPLSSEHDMVQAEARVNQVIWAARGVAVGLTAAVAAFLMAQAGSSWQYVAYPLLVGLPVAYSLVAGHVTRTMHVNLLRRHQAQLVIRTAELQDMASRDGLTGLYNRRYFYETLQTRLEKVRASKEPLAILTMDMDGLKTINDEYGHQVGDAIIANLAKVIAKHTRNSDVPARLGGDEFGVIMHETDKRGAFALAQRLWSELEQAPMFEQDGKRIMVNVSVGVSGFPWGGEDADELMHWADADMYANKVSRRLPPQPVPVDVPSDRGPLGDDYDVAI